MLRRSPKYEWAIFGKWTSTARCHSHRYEEVGVRNEMEGKLPGSFYLLASNSFLDDSGQITSARNAVLSHARTSLFRYASAKTNVGSQPEPTTSSREIMTVDRSTGAHELSKNNQERQYHSIGVAVLHSLIPVIASKTSQPCPKSDTCLRLKSHTKSDRSLPQGIGPF
jgi:hypothetical protein